MPRIEFDGKGEPIPTLALPPFGSDSDLPPTVVTFTENADFSVIDYMNLGFTHFEAWCVGAAGGRGGDATSQAMFIRKTVNQPVPSDVWNLWLERIMREDYQTQRNDYLNGFGPPPVMDRSYSPADWGYHYFNWMPSGSTFTAKQAENARNSSHILPMTTYQQALLFPSNAGMGGGGGGGGLHHVVGVLADLPDSVPVVVGEAGDDAGYGQVKVNGVWVAQLVDDPDFLVFNPASEPDANVRRLYELYNYFEVYWKIWPGVHSSFASPQPGGDGGASSFAGIGQASGGKGGSPGMIWDAATAKFKIKGDGGAGGIGNQVLSGGGAAGSVAEGVNGVDGVWNPETGIGSGGGGGKGGRASTVTGDPRFGNLVTTTHYATAGGQGSFSFADTSVYGQRQFRQAWTYLRPRATIPEDGTFTMIPETDQDLLIPGGGGGARPSSSLKVGSRAPGYSPNGAVVLRLTRIT